MYATSSVLTGHSLGMQQFKFGELKLTTQKKGINHLWKPRMSFLGETSCLCPVPLPFHVAIGIINMKFVEMDLPDFPLYACFLFLFSLYLGSHFHSPPPPPPPPHQDLFYRGSVFLCIFLLFVVYSFGDCPLPFL